MSYFDDSSKHIFKEINVHGKLNTEIDEIDLIKKIIYEDKNASKLYIPNPDFPQTEIEWANKQIYNKGKNRIKALQQIDFTVSSNVSEFLPQAEDIKAIRNYIFRIEGDTPALRQAVQNELNRLKIEFPDYDFKAIYGGVE